MSKIEVNEIDKQNGSTLTLGGSGTTVTLASGATQSGFGRSGSVNWDTTAKTASFTAVSGNGYFVNTTSGALTVTLPASPSAGDIVAIVDYAGTADTNNITVARNSSNINGGTDNLTISSENSGITLVYVDGTQGWKGTETTNLSDITIVPKFVTATGGTVTCTGNFRIHTFTGPGTFTVTCAGNPDGSTTVDYLVIGGGGAGGSAGGHGATVGSGGGAGGYRFSSGAASGCYTAGPSPLAATALPVTAQGYPITVGAGGAASFPSGCTSGANSVFSTITSAGGGGGKDTGPENGLPGGSGGGGGATIPTGGTGGTGNTPPVSPPQGNDGGNGQAPKQGGGGGGASAAGTPGATPNPVRGKGGDGLVSCITNSPVQRGGGGGGANTNNPPNAGAGGGGAGPNSTTGGAGGNGTANTGGGGGGGPHCRPSPNVNGGTGGSGIVIIRYKYQ